MKKNIINIDEDTIVAIATSMNNQSIGIIRISGKKTFDIIDDIFVDKNKNKINIESHKIYYGFIFDAKKDLILDEVILLPMKSPRSYTKEDVAEIQCHSNNILLKQILNLVLEKGARIAEPGEFTKRAFLNGRIDLTQAEAVADIINAKNEFSKNAATNTLLGNIKNKIVNDRQIILEEISKIESSLDDPEHINFNDFKNEFINKIKYLKTDLSKIIKSSQNGKILKEGINTVIVGQPNVGKSSLLNLLYGEERAIVTNIPGTTRDIIKEVINIDNITLNIVDTAGIRHTQNEIEKIGINKAKKELENANLIIFVTDISKYLKKQNEEKEAIEENKLFLEEDKKIFNQLLEYNKPIIVIYNKIDSIDIDVEDILKKQNEIIIKSINDEEKLVFEKIFFSTLNMTGYEELKQTIKNKFLSNDININTEIVITNERQLDILKKAYKSIQNVEEGIKLNISEDLLVIDLNDSYIYLSNILGEEVDDDVIDEVFSKFCMGK